MEMDLTGDDAEGRVARELAAIAAPPGRSALFPPEDPDVKPITEELLIVPHPSEPGVATDGTAVPLENPGHPELLAAARTARRRRR